MSTIVLVVLVILFGTFVVPVLQGLFTDEARGWLPHLARAVVRRAARRLPPAHRERYEDEWLAELAAYSDRRLTALVRACSLWIGARAMRAEFGGEVAPTRAAILDRGEKVPFAVSVVTWVDEEARQKDLPKLEKEIQKTIDSYEAEREQRVLELRESLERRIDYLRTGKQTGFSDDDLLWADTLEVNLKKLTDDERERMAKELGKQFDADISDTEAYRGRLGAHAPGLGAVPVDGVEAGDRGRDAVPRAEGPLRVSVRLGRVLRRRHGRLVGPRPAPQPVGE